MPEGGLAVNSKEIIKRLVAHDEPPRFGFDFANLSDFAWVGTRRYINLPHNPYDGWGDHRELKELTGFHGEVRRDIFGNIYGRFNGKTKGECIRGVIQDWDDYNFKMPDFDPNFRDELLKRNLGSSDRFIIGGGGALFSMLRDARLMANALMDTLLEPDAVSEFIKMLAEYEVSVIKSIAGCGLDGWMIADDLGTQETTFISPDSFRTLFKPYYGMIADALHEAGIAFFMHSCGNDTELLDDLIDAGIDVFQFDQPDVYPSEMLAEKYADRAVFHSPVDIQKVLPTGDREFIESRALKMCELFRAAGGGWIAKDYPSYGDIGVEKEWAAWAQNVIVENSKI